jgi:phosphoribosyl 1,2-cyclic phosphate phosphodiesterase
MNKPTPAKSMKITFLGTGTSQGVPIINCTCSVCSSDNPRNKRFRTSISIETNDTCLLFDTTPDLRQQLLNHPLSHLDAVIYTHAHADHIYGIDDLRRFNQLQKKRLPVYASPQTIKTLKMKFDYAFGNGALHLGVPNLEANEVNGPFRINNLEITPIKLYHGSQEVLGFRVGDFAYCTDVSEIPAKSYDLLQDLDVLVLDALRETSHPTHFSLEEAQGEAKKIGARTTYFIHMSHKINHEIHSSLLPQSMDLAYDGLTLNLS